MKETKKTASQLDPKLRERLLKESKSPFRGIRRIVWIALFGSSLIGLFVMAFREISGQSVLWSDGLIQVIAVMLSGSLLWFDRSRNTNEES